MSAVANKYAIVRAFVFSLIVVLSSFFSGKSRNVEKPFC